MVHDATTQLAAGTGNEDFGLSKHKAPGWSSDEDRSILETA